MSNLAEHVCISIGGGTIGGVPSVHGLRHPRLKLSGAVLAGRVSIQKRERRSGFGLVHPVPHASALSWIEACLCHQLEPYLVSFCFALAAERELQVKKICRTTVSF